MMEEKLPHTRKPPHRCGQGELWDCRGKHSNKCSNRYSEGQWRKFTTEIRPAEKWLTCPCPSTISGGEVQRLRLWRLDLRERTTIDCCEDILRGLV